ncbi:hypothetical protein I4U23_007565 [Adineta vaga]|nr:hypothetical protein I4U23_007565 [Adineta vaga]
MKQFGHILLFVFSIIFIQSSSCKKNKENQSVKSQEDAYTWLGKYGYNPCHNSDVQCSISIKSLLQEYQKRFHLKMTGTLDESTKKHMNRPRCGNKDKAIAELNTASQLNKYIWKRSSLTYSLRSFPTEINEADTNRIIREAFDAWLVHIPLEIKQVCSTCQADFVLDFARAQHTDTYPFDGVGGTLAHAFFPEDGRVHFDKDETWTEKFDGTGTNLYLVAVHEIGHALGVDHSYNERSIMYPSYQLMQKSNILPQPDRDDIQSMYGKKQSSPVRTTTTTTSPTRRPIITTATRRPIITTTTRRSIITTKPSVRVPSGDSHPRCRRYLDVAFDHPDGTLHTFDAGVLWRYLPDQHQWDSRTSTFQQAYAHLPKRLSGGVYDRNRNEVIFFAGRTVYQYKIDDRNLAKYRDEKSLPRNLQNSVVGAIYYQRAIHIITSKTIRLFEMDKGYQQSDERDLSEEFPRFTGTVTTAFSYGDLHHFFTSDRLVYVWDERLGNWKTFGEPMETGWFACSNTATNHHPYGMQAKKPTHKSPPRGSRHRHHHHHEHFESRL